MARVLGVDVSLGRGHDVALLDGLRVERTWTRVGSAAVGELLRTHAPDGIGIDAPPRPGLSLLRDPEGGTATDRSARPGTHLDRRIAEYELSRRAIGSHQTPKDEGRLFSWMTAGFEVFDAAREAGYETFPRRRPVQGRALEVFPYASYVALAGCLSPGRRHRLVWRRRVLEEASVQGLSGDEPIDTLDAVCAGLTAGRAVDGDGSWLGDPREGAIVVPVRRLEDRYRRCSAPDGPLRPADAAAPRLCECGCGEPVRRRFLPGHDAILKSRLVRQARAGDAAWRELQRLGWVDGEQRS